MFYRNHYRCPRCGHEWSFVWINQRSDHCPNCGGKAVAPQKSEIATIAQHEKIAVLNDGFRQTFSGGKVLMTPGVNELPDMVKAEALCKVAAFNDFGEDNDPYGEHDFGSVEVCGRKLFWKIEYYDPELQFGSEDPSDPARTTRVLTVMLAEEY